MYIFFLGCRHVDVICSGCSCGGRVGGSVASCAEDVNERPNSCKSSPPVSEGAVSVEISLEALA